jgi:DDE superfamily endonuclease
MPPHSSHFLQPLDVGCFGPLKTLYGKQIEKMMRMQITHITKDDFFAAFLEAFNASITEKNIQAGFRATGLVPYDPESVISRLDPKLVTPSPPISRSGTPNSWVTKTPQTSYDINQQSITIKNKIAKHQSSSPTHMYTVIDAQARGMSKMAHELVLLRAELKDVRAANEVLSKRRKAKKTRLRQGGSLSFQEAEDLVAENEVDKQIKEETHRSRRRTEGAEPRTRRCGMCGNAGHNARTCQVVVITSEEDISE